MDDLSSLNEGVEGAAQADELDRIFFALSDRTRRSMLQQLAQKDDLSVSELAAPFQMSLPAVLKHLKVLSRAGLLSEVKNGRVKRCHLQADGLAAAHQWTEHYKKFWTNKFDELEEYLKTLDED